MKAKIFEALYDLHDMPLINSCYFKEENILILTVYLNMYNTPFNLKSKDEIMVLGNIVFKNVEKLEDSKLGENFENEEILSTEINEYEEFEILTSISLPNSIEDVRILKIKSDLVDFVPLHYFI